MGYVERREPGPGLKDVGDSIVLDCASTSTSTLISTSISISIFESAGCCQRTWDETFPSKVAYLGQYGGDLVLVPWSSHFTITLINKLENMPTCYHCAILYLPICILSRMCLPKAICPPSRLQHYSGNFIAFVYEQAILPQTPASPLLREHLLPSHCVKS
jgi:hypothetical protein